MSLAEIKRKLEKAYNEEDWKIIEDLLEILSYEVEVEESERDGIYPYHSEDGHDEID